FLRVNPVMSEALGISRREETRATFFAFVHPDDLETTQEQILELRRQGGAATLELRFLVQGQGYIWHRWNFALDPGRRLLHGVGLDVSQRKIQEEEMRRGEDRF